MLITNEKTIQDLQEEFKEQFPYLKIHFYQHPHDHGIPSNENELLNSNLKIKNITNKVKGQENYSIDKSKTTSSFEQMMAGKYGLFVQVFRKEYGKWLQTWATDTWTLDEQNHRSQIMGPK